MPRSPKNGPEVQNGHKRNRTARNGQPRVLRTDYSYFIASYRIESPIGLQMRYFRAQPSTVCLKSDPRKKRIF